MGLLDAFLKGTGDPEKDAAINQGLLNAGLALMQARGRLFPALGQAGQVGLQAANQYTQQQQAQKRAGLQDQMLKYQIQGQQREQQIADLPRQFVIPGQKPDTMDNRDVGQPGEQPIQSGFNQEGYMSALRAMDYPRWIQQQAAIQKQAPKLETTPEGAVGSYWNGKEWVKAVDNPKPAKDPKDYEILALQRALDELPAGDPRRKPIQQRMQVLGTHGNPVAVIDMKQPSAFATGQGKEFSDMMGGINKQSFAAPAQLRKLERMQQLLEGVDGGKLAPVGLEIASAANAMGIKMDPKLGNKEAAQALAREIAGGFRQPGTGPMTDKDFENFLLQVPDLSKSAQGRAQITATMKAALNRDIALGKLAREYVKRNGQLDNGFLDEASTFIAENPVVGSPAGWKVQR